MIRSNVVSGKKLVEVRLETLKFLADCLKLSFGPDGSNTTISGGTQTLTRYTKDGKSILSKIEVIGDIESSTKEDIYEITRSVVKEVGDGTTSAILLSHLIFEELLKSSISKDLTPFEVMRQFQSVVNDIIKQIKTRSKELDLDAVYKIAMVSTNGNVRIAETLRDIYAKFGSGVFIDVAVSSNGVTALKEYNGMNLQCGYMDPSFVNTSKNKCIIPKPRIYAFIDPINTLEQAQFFDKIIYDNIVTAINENKPDMIVPTVILVPSISRDMSNYIDNIIGMFSQQSSESRLPLCVVTNITQTEQYMDIIKMIGAKPIQKSIDKKIYEEMVKKGLAPTLDNISKDFYGTCEVFECDADKSKFVNPKEMRDENGDYSKTFNVHLNYLETELKKRKEQGANAHEIGEMKRRIQSLKGNLVEFHIGGISAADRDSVRDLVEDAVLNIRSADEHGYGMASNVEGLYASYVIDYSNDYHKDTIKNIINRSYRNLIKILYSNSNITDSDGIINNIIEQKGTVVYDVVKKEFNKDIIASIESDCAVLDAIAKILTLIYTSNQFICRNTAENKYM
jgi:chaperonin GroEL (HSP60 family)